VAHTVFEQRVKRRLYVGNASACLRESDPRPTTPERGLQGVGRVFEVESRPCSS